MTAHARPRTLYFLMFANLTLFVLLLVTLNYVAGLRDDVEQSLAQQRSACSRGNLIRAQVNYNASVTQAFLAQAATTREEQAAHDEEIGDPASAQINRDAAKGYRALSAGFTPLPLIDCESIYP